MVKILSRAGVSLADTYDVVGSIAGVEQLNSDDVSLVHEMGHTIFSERLVGVIERGTTGAIAQNINFNIAFTDLTEVPGRILGVMGFTDTAARLTAAACLVTDPLSGREVPIWAWDTANDGTARVRMQDNGGAVSTVIMLLPSTPQPNMPSLLTGTARAQTVSDINFRGQASGFGAGTVTLTMLVYLAFPEDASGLSSAGLPLPSW